MDRLSVTPQPGSAGPYRSTPEPAPDPYLRAWRRWRLRSAVATGAFGVVGGAGGVLEVSGQLVVGLLMVLSAILGHAYAVRLFPCPRCGQRLWKGREGAKNGGPKPGVRCASCDLAFGSPKG